jgi:hypothetical protein
MDEGSREVLETYAKLNLPHLAARTLSNARPFLMVSIVGEQGVGKSTYAYYSVKVGLMAYLCKPHGINLFKEPERCASHLEGNYGEICLTKECGGPDQLDKTYELDVYTGPRGLDGVFVAAATLARLGQKKKVLFLDDVLARTAYHLGPKYRAAYAALRELIRLARVVGAVVVMTAPTKEYLPPEVPKEGEFIVGHFGLSERRFVRMHAANYADRDGYLRKRLVVKYSDAVPAKAAFGMPKWLEEEITKRKRKAIIDIARLGRSAFYELYEADAAERPLYEDSAEMYFDLQKYG